MGLLDDIVASKVREVARIERRAFTRAERTSIDVRQTLTRRATGPLGIIAEIKWRSPSAGPLSRALDAEGRALAYARGGASMISVLCDAPFFDGGWDELRRARAALDGASLRVPLLAKEFVIDERQIELAQSCGADAVLLIARIVSAERLEALSKAAFDLGIEPFVEVTTEEELGAARAARARVIGVNARDLDTLAIDKDRTARLLTAIPEGGVRVHLSGLRSAADVREVAKSPVDAALIGEALMRQDDPLPLLTSMAAAAAGPRA